MKFNFKPARWIKHVARTSLIVSSFAFGVSVFGGAVALQNSDAINNALSIQTQKIVQGEDTENVDPYYYKSSFKSVKEVLQNGKNYNESTVKEGVVLLKNGDPTKKNNEEVKPLPLAKNSKVTLFSASSARALLTGTTNASSSAISLSKGLKNAGIIVNEGMEAWYNNNFNTYGRQMKGDGGPNTYLTINDASWDKLPAEHRANKEYGDAAIFVLTRGGGEGRDDHVASTDTSDMTKGNYLLLNKNEMSVLENLKLEKDKGTFKKIIVLMNAANQVQLDFVDDPKYGIDAFMWVGTYGQYGANAIAKLLVGDYNPSGRLPDTFWKYHYKNPTLANFSYLANGTNNIGQWSSNPNPSYSVDKSSLVYQEGVYLGYRYTETRYEDYVTGKGNAGEFIYSDSVAYPFGDGLSYTNFDYSDFSVTRAVKNPNPNAPIEEKENRYICKVKVTNVGEKPGKETVQIYAQKPYTEYDKNNFIEKPAVELVGFEKTEILAPGKSQVLEIVVGESKLTSYDAHGKGTYILEAGDHYLIAAHDAHAAVNNVLAKRNYNKKSNSKMDEDGNQLLVEKITFDEMNATTYAKSISTGNPIFNKFDEVDLKRYEHAGTNKDAFKYVTRSDWSNTLMFGIDENNVRTNQHVNVKINDEMMADYKAQNNRLDVGQGNGPWPTYGKASKYQLIDLRAYADDDDDPTNDKKIPYDDPMWDDLLDSLTFEETANFLYSGYRKTQAIPKIGKPLTIDQNGGTGVIVKFNETGDQNNRGLAVTLKDQDRSKKPVTYACNGIIAATYNKRLCNYYGRQWGEDMLWSGLSGLYGMGVNIHRTPYSGRNYHYYSEDPTLTGLIAAEVTKGIATRGGYVYLKHAFLNDQETGRTGIRTWANEQTIREIYLKTFQIAIEVGGASCVMTSMNSLGMYWSGGQGFCNECLRDEFGMTGHVVTDTYTAFRGNWARSIYFGNDLPDGGANDKWCNLDFAKPGEGYSEMAWAMREAVHRVLYNTVHSNAMNNITASTRVITITPSWMKAIDVAQLVSTITFGICAGAWAIVQGFELTNFIIEFSKKRKGGNN